jgi:hypothetical protein
LFALPQLEGGEGEGALYAFSSVFCGLAFRLSYEPTDQDHERLGSTWKKVDLQALPPDVKIVEIEIFGCKVDSATR